MTPGRAALLGLMHRYLIGLAEPFVTLLEVRKLLGRVRVTVRPSSAMRDAAASAGRFMEIPRVQIYTIEDYFEDRKPVMPRAA